MSCGDYRMSTMIGMGDNLYAAPAIASWLENNPGSTMELHTPWPQFYPKSDRLTFRPMNSKIECAQKNVDEFKWNEKAGASRMEAGKIEYRTSGKEFRPIWEQIMESLSKIGNGAKGYFLEMQNGQFWNPDLEEPYVLVRPATTRKDWDCGSRNSDQCYIQAAVNLASKKGFKTVMVANISKNEEFHQFKPFCDVDLINCTNTQELLVLFEQAAAVISPVGFPVPLCQALGTPALIVHGGFGKFNRPEVVDALSVGNLLHLLPINYCADCSNKYHACDKTIDPKALQDGLDLVLEEFTHGEKRRNRRVFASLERNHGWGLGVGS